MVSHLEPQQHLHLKAGSVSDQVDDLVHSLDVSVCRQ